MAAASTRTPTAICGCCDVPADVEIKEPVDPTYVATGLGLTPSPLEFVASSAPFLQSLAELLGIDSLPVDRSVVAGEHPFRRAANALGDLIQTARNARVRNILRSGGGDERMVNAPIWRMRALPTLRRMLNQKAGIPQRIVDSILDYGAHYTDPRTLDELTKTPVEGVARENLPAAPKVEIGRRMMPAVRERAASKVAQHFTSLSPDQRQRLGRMEPGMVMLLPNGAGLFKDADGTVRLM